MKAKYADEAAEKNIKKEGGHRWERNKTAVLMHRQKKGMSTTQHKIERVAKPVCTEQGEKEIIMGLVHLNSEVVRKETRKINNRTYMRKKIYSIGGDGAA